MTLAPITHQPGVLIFHPLGTLQVSQRAIPLDLTLDKAAYASGETLKARLSPRFSGTATVAVVRTPVIPPAPLRRRG